MTIMAEWSSSGRPDLKYVKRRKTTYEELNNLVWEWFTTARSKDLPVSGRLIQVLYWYAMFNLYDLLFIPWTR